MTETPVIRTERLTLRSHRMSDWEPFGAFLDSDGAKYVGGPMPRRRSWYVFAADVGCWNLRGFGAWAIEVTATGAFAGQVALNKPSHFPEAEIGWIVFPPFQRRGFATEAALAARAHAYGPLGWRTAVSYIHPENAASIAVARHLGCAEDVNAARFDAEDLVFRHPTPEAAR